MLMINTPSEDLRRSCWQWFEIEEQPQIPGVRMDVFIRYRNKAGRVRHKDAVLSIRPSFPGISLSEPAENLQTAVMGRFQSIIGVAAISSGRRSLPFLHTHSLFGEALN